MLLKLRRLPHVWAYVEAQLSVFEWPPTESFMRQYSRLKELLFDALAQHTIGKERELSRVRFRGVVVLTMRLQSAAWEYYDIAPPSVGPTLPSSLPP